MDRGLLHDLIDPKLLHWRGQYPGPLRANGPARVATAHVADDKHEYHRQFAASEIQGYRLDNLSVTPGWAGRASAGYTVTRAGGRDFGGRVVFGVRRVNGDPKIGLIATQSS